MRPGKSAGGRACEHAPCTCNRHLTAMASDDPDAVYNILSIGLVDRALLIVCSRPSNCWLLPRPHYACRLAHVRLCCLSNKENAYSQPLNRFAMRECHKQWCHSMRDQEPLWKRWQRTGMRQPHNH